MTWHPGQTRDGHPDPYFQVSDPRGFTIAKFWIFGEPMYESWRGKEMLATRLPSADAARATVERVAG